MIPGQLPPWDPIWALSPEQEVLHARDMSERPLHGVPSVWRDPNLEWMVYWLNGPFYLAQNIPVPDTIRFRDGRVAKIFDNLAALADVVGFYTRRIRFSHRRGVAILAILHVAEYHVHRIAEDYGTRAWMHRVCQEALKR